MSKVVGKLRAATKVAPIICLFLLLAGAWIPAHAGFGDCADADYLNRFDARFDTGDYDCVEPLRVPVVTGDGTRHIRVLHDLNADWILEPSTMRDFERGVRASVAALGTIGRYSMSDVTILLADDFSPPSGTEAFSSIMGMANGAADSDECLIVLYLISAGGSHEEAAATVAHEIFHCVQAATFSPGQYGAYRSEGGAAWWIEGSAEWFSSLALPDDSIYQERVDSFDAISPDTPLHEMTYSALPFFLWHAQRHGNSATMVFLSGMADSSAASEQMQAMAASLDASEWLRFAQDYFDREIRRPHGTPLRFSPVGEVWSWTGSRTERLRLEPFVLQRSFMQIDCGEWEASMTPPDAPYSSRTSRASGGHWGEFPPRITVSGDTQQRLFIGFNATPTPLPLQIRLDQQSSCNACAGVTTADQCLVGNWQEISGGAAEWIRSNLSHGVRAQASINRQAMTLGADGNFSTTPLSGTFSLDAGPDGRSEGRVANVQSSGRWSSSDGRLHLCPAIQTYDAQARMITRSGGAIPIPLPAASVPVPKSLTYTCIADTLHTELPIPGMPPLSTTFKRVE